MTPLVIKKVDCILCYKCINKCKVNAIQLKNEGISIIEDRCTLCGDCLNSCSQNAITYSNNIINVTNFLSTDEEVVAILDSSYKAAFGFNSSKVVHALKKLGFSKIYDTSFGGDIHTYNCINNLKNYQKNIALSSTCPVTNNLIQKYYSNLVHYLLPVQTPVKSLSAYLKSLNENIKIVHISPCISFQEDNETSTYVDETLTFANLESWVLNEKMNLRLLNNSDLDSAESYGSLLPIENGIFYSIKKQANISFENNKIFGYNCIAVSGLKNVMEVLKDIDLGKYRKCFFQLSSCGKSCISIPVATNTKFSVYESLPIMLDVSNLKSNTEIPEDLDVSCQFTSENLKLYTTKDINYKKDLQLIGTIEAMNQVNCKKCGFDSCIDYAHAIRRGNASSDLCNPQKTREETLKELTSYEKAVVFVAVDKNLTVRQINTLGLEIFKMEDSKVLNQNIGNILDAHIFENIFKNKKSVYNAKMKCNTLGILLEATIIYLKEEELAVGMLQDITEKEKIEEALFKLKTDSVAMAQQVIDKQMIVAQEIASLLGETTAETKTTLNNLKKLLLDEGVDKIGK